MKPTHSMHPYGALLKAIITYGGTLYILYSASSALIFYLTSRANLNLFGIVKLHLAESTKNLNWFGVGGNYEILT